jgi:hypothetical protein
VTKQETIARAGDVLRSLGDSPTSGAVLAVRAEFFRLLEQIPDGIERAYLAEGFALAESSAGLPLT